METLVKNGNKNIPVTETFDAISIRLQAVNGHHIDSLIATLGIPSDEKTIAGKRIVYWRLDQLVVIDDRIVVPGKCVISSIISDSNTIIKSEASGNNGGCSKFLEKFRDD